MPGTVWRLQPAAMRKRSSMPCRARVRTFVLPSRITPVTRHNFMKRVITGSSSPDRNCWTTRKRPVLIHWSNAFLLPIPTVFRYSGFETREACHVLTIRGVFQAVRTLRTTRLQKALAVAGPGGVGVRLLRANHLRRVVGSGRTSSAVQAPTALPSTHRETSMRWMPAAVVCRSSPLSGSLSPSGVEKAVGLGSFTTARTTVGPWVLPLPVTGSLSPTREISACRCLLKMGSTSARSALRAQATGSF